MTGPMAMSRALVRRAALATMWRRAQPSRPMRVACCVHTEALMDDEVFARALRFAVEYREATGKQAIFAVMPGCNEAVALRRARAGVSGAAYAERISRLQEVAHLGYHGHYWIESKLRVDEGHAGSAEDALASPMWQIRSNNFVAPDFDAQIRRDCEWFADHHLDVSPFYAGGWWFLNAHVASQLIDQGFSVDMTLNRSLEFSDEFARRLLADYCIGVGTPVELTNAAGRLTCVESVANIPFSAQPGATLMRNVARLESLASEPEQTQGESIVGVVSIHDWELGISPGAIECCRELMDREVEFLGPELAEVARAESRISLGLDSLPFNS
jgi:hypothetical protein